MHLDSSKHVQRRIDISRLNVRHRHPAAGTAAACLPAKLNHSVARSAIRLHVSVLCPRPGKSFGAPPATAASAALPSGGPSALPLGDLGLADVGLARLDLDGAVARELRAAEAGIEQPVAQLNAVRLWQGQGTGLQASKPSSGH